MYTGFSQIGPAISGLSGAVNLQLVSAGQRGRVEQGLQVGGGAWSNQARKEQGGWAMRGVRVGELLSEGEGRASVGGARRRKRSSAGELGGAASRGQVGRAGELLLSRCRAGGCCWALRASWAGRAGRGGRLAWAGAGAAGASERRAWLGELGRAACALERLGRCCASGGACVLAAVKPSRAGRPEAQAEWGSK
jgi:hypothetical protein